MTREKLQHRRTFQFSGQHKSSRLNPMQSTGFALMQIVGVTRGNRRQGLLIGFLVKIKLLNGCTPRLSELFAQAMQSMKLLC
ncbi:Uncharacterised protein [Vibrio cholerae]|uniref:Uncharacterized protein n=1 Tax=Vibrio cholerae TaxID=666 RepID=A0A655WHI2_VIBCL|nr:Uncharacterised protein [Vibrio cholerae]